MKKHIIFPTLIGIACFFLGFFFQKRQCEKFTLELAWRIDDLKQMETYRRNEQLPYFGLEKDEVLAMLPKPEWGDSEPLPMFDDGSESIFWLYWQYLSRLTGTKDTIYLSTYYWEIPYSDRPNLYIVFEKIDTSMIVTECVQWDAKRVSID
jgi:hypothetical protein